MWKDEIAEDKRRSRDAYAAKFNYDLEAICRDLKKQEQQGKRHTVSFSSKKPEQLTIAKPEEL